MTGRIRQILAVPLMLFGRALSARIYQERCARQEQEIRELRAARAAERAALTEVATRERERARALGEALEEATARLRALLAPRQMGAGSADSDLEALCANYVLVWRGDRWQCTFAFDVKPGEHWLPMPPPPLVDGEKS